jgi:hypothetical protein
LIHPVVDRFPRTQVVRRRSDRRGHGFDAGAHVARLSGKLYEPLKALVEHRPRLDLYHSVLQIRLPDDRFVIECATILNLRGEERGVVAGGPVEMSWLGRSPA